MLRLCAFFRYKAKKKAFTKYVAKYADGKKEIEAELAQMKKHCSTIRVLAHTQVGCGNRCGNGACSGWQPAVRCDWKAACSWVGRGLRSDDGCSVDW